MRAAELMTLGGVFISLLVIPSGLTYFFTQYGAPGDSQMMAIVGLVALLPGFVMGGTALWVAAQG